MINEDNIRIIFKALLFACAIAFYYYHFRKIRKQGKAEFDRMLLLTIKYGVTGLLVFLVLAALWWWLKNISPTWQTWLRTGLFGLVLGIGVGMIRDIRTEERRDKTKRGT